MKNEEQEIVWQLILCIDCKSSHDNYMVLNPVWKAACPDYVVLKKTRKHVNLCLACLESRLGRNLVAEDFTSATINDAIRLGIRIGLRMKVS